ncbi:MAG: ATP-dependent RNA helicase HrpA [Chitinispirillaceae bacterium]|nr:ATP-dependent RNA helicase HrpA [Chitinispirillaceae bacterium]
MQFRYLSHLPVHEKHDEIVSLIRSERVVILSGETGCGKTTQLPLFCLEAGRGTTGKIGCTQPRRVAAQTLFNFVESRFEPEFRNRVGYKVRFNEKNADECIIRFMTDGILVAEASIDPLLARYDTIILDEVHERSVNIDLLLGFLKMLLSQRDDLHIIIASATLNTELFSRYFNNAPVVTIRGRLYPVEISWRPVIELWKGESIDSYIEGVIVNVLEVIQTGNDGDILVFLPTIDDVYDTVNKLQHRVIQNDIQFFSLHSRSSTVDQKRIFEKTSGRKVIVSTNVAETSITVPGIRYVIDSGLARILRYDTKAAISRMPVEKISRSAAQQRAGRCGRTENGFCIRLYSEQDFLSRPLYTQPEIKRSNLSGVLLRLYQLSARYVKQFPFILRPHQSAINNGLGVLRELGAVDSRGNLTVNGRKMARLPLDPSISRMLLFSMGNGTFNEISVIAAALSVDGLTVSEGEEGKHNPAKFRHPQSDFLTFLSIWKELNLFKCREHNKNRGIRSFCREYGLSYLRIREWVNIHQQIVSYCNVAPFKYIDFYSKQRYEAIHKSLLSGMSGGVAVRCNQFEYEGVSTGNIRLFPGSSLFRKNPDWVLCHEIVETGQIYGRYAAVINPRWIESLFRYQCHYNIDEIWYEPQSGEVKGREEVIWKGLTLTKNRIIDMKNLNRQRASECFIEQALIHAKSMIQFDFINCNNSVISTIHAMEQKIRKTLFAGDDVLHSFYEERLENICSDKELLSKIKKEGNDRFLCVSREELMLDDTDVCIGNFPDTLTILEHQCACHYFWNPGEADDGVTIDMSGIMFAQIPSFYWDWVHPELTRQRILFILQQLEYPVGEAVVRIAGEFLETHRLPLEPFSISVVNFFKKHGIELTVEDIETVVPPYLWIRVSFDIDKDRRSVVRTPIKETFLKEKTQSPSLVESPLLQISDNVNWKDPDVLSAFELKTDSQMVPLCGWVALFFDGNRVKTRLYLHRDEAVSSQINATTTLILDTLAEQLAWTSEEMQLKPVTRQKFEKLFETADTGQYVSTLIIRYILGDPQKYAVNELQLKELITEAENKFKNVKTELQLLIDKIIISTERVLTTLMKRIGKNDGSSSLAGGELLSELDFFKRVITSEVTPFYFLEQIPSFLDSLHTRIDAAFYDFRKYSLRMQDVYTFREMTSVSFAFNVRVTNEQLLLWRHRWYVEQYCCDLFSSSTIKAHNRNSLEELKRMIIGAGEGMRV